MQPLRGSYTNRTFGDGATVVKFYQGPGARARAGREHAVLRTLHGHVAVPAVLDSEDGWLTMRFMTGTHGQELLETGQASGVLSACGTMLQQIHHTREAALPCRMDEGQVLVHGDYGPQNVLLDPGTCRSRRSWTGNGHTPETPSRTWPGANGSSACTIPPGQSARRLLRRLRWANSALARTPRSHGRPV
jgi:hypothetical protein